MIGQAVKCDQCGATEMIIPNTPPSLGWMNFVMNSLTVNLCSFRCAVRFLRAQMSASEWREWTAGLENQAADPSVSVTIKVAE